MTIAKCIRKDLPSAIHREPEFDVTNKGLTMYDQLDTDTLPFIYVITPTHARYTQKVDLMSLCHTLMHVPNLVWIVIEDSEFKTDLVLKLLQWCQVESVHLNNPKTQAIQWPFSWFTSLRGVPQRNEGLRWLRKYCARPENAGQCKRGVVYFADDDNKYDVRLFEKIIRKTEKVSVFAVAFAGGLKFEGPVCSNGKAISWHSASESSRKIPIDMAGFAMNVTLILQRPELWIGKDVHGKDSGRGHLETDFIEHIATRETVECRGSNSEVYVWHTKTMDPNLKHEWLYGSDRFVEV